MENNRYALLITGLVLLALLVASAGFFYYYKTVLTKNNGTLVNTKKIETSKKIDSGRRLILTGNSAEAIPTLEESVKNSVDPEQEALAKINLGTAYMYALQPEKGVPLLKEISLNTNYPVQYRALAGQFAVEYYLSGKDIDFALQTIFTGPTWGDFLTGNPKENDVDAAVIKSLEWITSLSPAFGPEYVLASKYADWIKQGVNPDMRASYITLAHQHLDKGDTEYQKALEKNQAFREQNLTSVPPYSDNRLGVGIEHKALALDALFLAKATEKNAKDVESTYEEAIALLEQDSTLNSALVSGLYTRFHLAVFLARVDAKKYSQIIIDTLAPINKTNSNLRQSNFYQSFLRNYGKDTRYRNTDAWKDIVLVAHIDPLFKNLLIELGWNTNDFK